MANDSAPLPTSAAKRQPAGVWPVGEFIADELRERKWTRRDLVSRLGGSNVDQLAIDLLIDAPRKGMMIGKDLAADLARVFGASAEYWLNLDRAWQQKSGSGALSCEEGRTEQK